MADAEDRRAERRSWARYRRRNPSESEAMLWQALRNRQLAGFKFRRQALLFGSIVDFYCPERKLIVELDDPSHASRQDADARRDSFFRIQGFHTVRVPEQRLFSDLQAVLSEIRALLPGESRRRPQSR